MMGLHVRMAPRCALLHPPRCAVEPGGRTAMSGGLVGGGQHMCGVGAHTGVGGRGGDVGE